MTNQDSSNLAVLRTLIYASVFDSGIKKSELRQLLISPQKFTQAQIEKSLKTLVVQKLVILDRDWVWLEKYSSFPKSVKRYGESRVKLTLLNSYLPWISWIPAIEGIAVTGSVAIGNATPEDDIDLMIVTRRGFLWSTRALVQGILMLRGVLRTRGASEFRNKLCLNLWLDDGELQLSTHSLYVARELVQTIWVLDRSGVVKRLFRANNWIKSYVANHHDSKHESHRSSIFMSTLMSQVFAPVESLAFLLETAHMRSRTREIVKHHQAFFHPRDTQGNTLKKYQRLCAYFGVDSLVR